MERTTPPRRWARLLVTLALVGMVVAAGLLGLFKVDPGEILALRRGGEVRTFGPGWHWRLPVVGETLTLPVEPLAAARDLEVRTAEGATVTVSLRGTFAVSEETAARWLHEAGWVPFLDGVWEQARAVISAGVSGAEPASLLGEERARELGRAVREALGDAGLEITDIEIHVPVASNPALAAVARSEVEKLATPARRRRKVLMVGWDAADWLLIRPLLEAGRMPNLARIVARGASGDLRSQMPLLSPLVWTTIATGKPVPEHGVADFLVIDPATGSRVPISSEARKVHALWTILTAMGMRSDVIGYWATWPAEPILGHMVTDRVAYQLFGYDAGASAEGKVYPPEYWGRVRDLTVSAEQVSWEDVRRFVDVTEDELRQAWESLPPDRRQENKLNHLRKIIAGTRTYERIALDLLEDQAELTIVYFEGTDTVGHLFGRYLPPRMPMVSEEEVRRYGRALPEFYVYADEILGRLVAAADEGTEVIVLSDHGFYGGALRPESDPADFTTGAPQWHRLQGIVAGAGPGIRHHTLEHASIYDITPTVLAILGLPVPSDMRGDVLTPLVPADQPPSIGELASYETLPRVRPERVARSAEADLERLRELVALGYISPGAIGESAPRGAAAPPAATAPTGVTAAATPTPRMKLPEGAALAPGGSTALPTQKLNLVQGLVEQERYDEARRVTLELIGEAPGFAAGYTMLARLMARDGNIRGEYDALAQGVIRAQDMRAEVIPQMVDTARRAGRLDSAAAVLEKVRVRYGNSADYHAAWGVLERGRGRPADALPHFQRALEIAPGNPQALEGMIVTLRALGRHDEAKQTLATQIASGAATVDRANSLAAIALDQGWPDLAEPLLRKVLANDPGHAGVLLNLGVCLAQLGRPEEAAGYFKRLLEVDARNTTALYNLGFIAGVQGRFTEALDYLERAESAGLNTGLLHVTKARAYFFLDDRQRCESELRKALAIEPGNQEARRLLTLLTQAR